MAVKALLHYALEVPDQGAGEKFYSNFGLLNAPSRDAAVRLRPAPLQRESVLLYGGAEKGPPPPPVRARGGPSAGGRGGRGGAGAPGGWPRRAVRGGAVWGPGPPTPIPSTPATRRASSPPLPRRSRSTAPAASRARSDAA